MPELKPSAIRIYDEYSAAIGKCRSELIRQKWFKDNWWLNVGLGSRGFGFQLSKIHWFNHGGQGIHIEFWIEEEQHVAKMFPIVLHFESGVPNRKELGARFEREFRPLEPKFSDYRINHRAVCDKLQKQEKLSKAGLPKAVLREFSRLREIGSVIDRII